MSSRSLSRSGSPAANGRDDSISRSRSVSRSVSSASRGRSSRSRSYTRSGSRSVYSRSRSYSRSPTPRRRSYSRSPPRGRERYSGENSTLFVGNLSDETDDRALKSLCNRYGEVMEVKVIAHPVTRRPRGYGFVKFAIPREAEEAAEALNGKNVDGPPSERPYRPRGGGGGGYRRGGYREGRGGGGYYSPRPRSYYPPRYEESPPPYYRGRRSRYY